MLKFVKVIFNFCDEHKVISISPAKIPAGIGLRNSFKKYPSFIEQTSLKKQRQY